MAVYVKAGSKSFLLIAIFNIYAINRDVLRGNITDMDTTNWMAAPLISIVNPD